jgi:predicted DNA-binding helix-hairpin-helix protein
VAELTTREERNLPLDLDPKLAWALRNPEKFPIDLNNASREMLLRVPGLGVRNVDRIICIRRWHSMRVADLVRLRVPLRKSLPFVIASDHIPHQLKPELLISRFVKAREQSELFRVAA